MKSFAVVILVSAALFSAAGAGEPVLKESAFFSARLPLLNLGGSAGSSLASPMAPVMAGFSAGASESSSTAMVPAKSKGKAFLLSLLLPGLGERYVGAREKAQIFLGTEIGLWLGYAGFLTYADWRREEYQSYAAAHAGVDPDGKSDTYYVNIGNFPDIEQYNAAKLRQRNLYEYYRDVEAYYWSWDSPQSRAQFDRIRLSADRAGNRATFVIGAIFANHLVSAIDAVWSAHKANRKQVSSVGWDLRFGDGIIQPNLLFSLQTRF